MNVNEYGVVYVQGTGFDLSGNSSLSIVFTKPDGTQLTVSSPDVTAPASPIVTTEGTFAANTYTYYTFQPGDIDQVGDWTARSIYNDAPTVHLISEVAAFTINP